VVDAPEGHRAADGLRRLRVCPGARRNEQRTLGVRVVPAHLLEQVAAGRTEKRRRRQHDRHLFTGARELRQHPSGLVRIGQTLHAIVTRVPLDELSLDAFERSRVVVDGK
jgi:hypothetical protein